MIKTNWIRNLSANVLALICNQILGLVIFYILSVFLNKNDFGHLNLVLAILLSAFNILSLGIDQLIIKRVASGKSVKQALSLYSCHVLIAGFLFYAILFSVKVLLPDTSLLYGLLLLVGAGKLMIFFSTPFKQIANGLEQFRLLAYILVTSNLVRAAGLIVLATSHAITIWYVAILFIAGDFAELLCSCLLFKYRIKIPLSLEWDRKAYIQLIKESLPQAGVAIITSALARFDWIFIGVMLSSVKLAEYSFGYKVFEISTLPLLAIAPLLIPYFTKLFLNMADGANHLKFLIKTEIMVAALIALILNIAWAPVMDALTKNKYGAINVSTIFILSLCMPLLYVNNFLWTIYFAKGRLRMILHSFIISLLINVAGDILLIPIFKNEGAAFAFLLSCLAQTIFYLAKNDIAVLNGIWSALFIVSVCALCSGVAIRLFSLQYWFALPMSVVLYLLLLMATRQIQRADQVTLRELWNR